VDITMNDFIQLQRLMDIMAQVLLDSDVYDPTGAPIEENISSAEDILITY